MPKRISDLFGITRKVLAKEGAFDRFIDIDSRLHVDPFLLRKTRIPELDDARTRFRKRFTDVLLLLSQSKEAHDALYREAVRQLTFPEPHFVALGYAEDGTRGSGIGSQLAERIAATATQIIKAGTNDPQIFELVGLFEENIGADRISDMTVNIIRPNLYRFTDRVVKTLGLPSKSVHVGDSDYLVPQVPNSRKRIVLVPKSLLRDLPVAEDWSDVDTVCRYNDALRRRVNKQIGSTWRHATRRVSKRELRAVLIEHPGVLRDLIQQYSEKTGAAYDFARDPAGLFSWLEVAQAAAQGHPADLSKYHPVTPENLHALVTEICHHFKRLVEVNGWERHLYDDKGHPRREMYPQLLFYGIADAYCEANNLDLSREANGGRGPVDFKISQGRVKVAVEVKYSHNPRLVHGFEKQLPEYNRAERSTSSIYLIIRTSNSDASIKRVQALSTKTIGAGQRVPDIVIVDGRRRPSASRL